MKFLMGLAIPKPKNFSICLISGLMWVSICFADPPPPPTNPVWYSTTRPPQEVFQHGLAPHGNDNSVMRYIMGTDDSRRSTAFITVFRRSAWPYHETSQLLRENTSISQIYVYQIRPTNNFYSIAITLSHLLRVGVLTNTRLPTISQRIARYYVYFSYGSIPPQQIYSVATIARQPDGSITVHENYNPNYIPDGTTFNPGPFLGNDSLPPQTLPAPPMEAMDLSVPAFMAPELPVDLRVRPLMPPGAHSEL